MWYKYLRASYLDEMTYMRHVLQGAHEPTESGAVAEIPFEPFATAAHPSF